MGTRCQVFLIGRSSYDKDAGGKYDSAVSLYRHSDGDGLTMMHDVLAAIRRAEAKIVKDIRFRTENVRHLSVSVMKALLISETGDANEVALTYESNWRSAPRMSHLDSAEGLAWCYVIDCEAKSFNIYSIKKLGEEMTEGLSNSVGHIGAGALSDPISWENALRHGKVNGYDIRPDIEELADLLDQLKATGWAICEKEDPYYQLVKKRVKKSEEKSLIAPAHQAVNSAFCI